MAARKTTTKARAKAAPKRAGKKPAPRTAGKKPAAKRKPRATKTAAASS